jgi:UDP-glucose 4-epimerase
MATWLVTGGCGFIGSHLADALVARGDRVRIIDDLSAGRRENAPRKAETCVGDVSDRELARRAIDGVDGCFHLAAVVSVPRSIEAWADSHRTNLTGAITVFDAARERRLPVVYASSAAVYGDNPDVPLGETAATRPLSPYGADKLGCELHAFTAWQNHKLPTAGMRFFNVYGPRQDPLSPYAGVIALFAERILADRPVHVFGDGGQVRDFIYVADVVRHLLAAMARLREGAEVFNVCTGRATRVIDLARLIADVVGRTPRVLHQPPRTGDIHRSIGAPDRAISALGLAARTSLADGLRETLTAMRGTPARELVEVR